jgi:CRP-like cAMP-binding protein
LTSSDLPTRLLWQDALIFFHADQLNEPEKRHLPRHFDGKRRHPAGHELIAVGAPLNAPMLLLSGWAAQVIYLPDGRRQVIDFCLPGELLGYCSRPAKAKAAFVALTVVDVVAASALLEFPRAPREYDAVVAALHNVEEAHERRLIAQIVRNGRQSAVERLASLLCELFDRVRESGHAEGSKFAFPITQEMLADALGLSVVHVNRTMQQLKRAHLIATDGTSLEIMNVSGLQSLAQVDV